MISDSSTQMLTIDEVAGRLHVSRRTVEEWIRAKDLASFKKGGNRLVSLEDLTRFVNLNTVKPKRPDWLTAPVESDFRNLLRQEVRAALLEQQKAA